MSDDAATMYLDLLKRTLTRALFEDSDEIIGFSSWSRAQWKRRAAHVVGSTAARLNLEIVRKRPYNAHARAHGLDWPSRAETMAGLKRLENVEHCVRVVVAERIPGDLVETGVWRGGTSILMRGVLAALGDNTRSVWAADSFQGLPPPNSTAFPADAGDEHYRLPELAVSLEEVQRNFRRYGLLDDRVKFLKGFFKDTLPGAPIDAVAVLRLDGDMYESTIQALDSLYPKLSSGGFCIVDDYHQVPACKEAIHDYRRDHGVQDQVHEIDGSAVFWRRA